MNKTALLIMYNFFFRRKISSAEGKEYADSIGKSFFECSAKTGEGVNNLFVKLS